MLLDKKHLIRGQQILAKLGYYRGKIDGIWGPSTIEAKKEFESSGKYSPGNPNRGLPFSGQPPFPASICLGNDGLLTVVGVDSSEFQKIAIVETPKDIKREAVSPQGQLQEKQTPRGNYQPNKNRKVEPIAEAIKVEQLSPVENKGES